MTDLDAIREPLERIAVALERLVALEERKAGSAKKVSDLAECHQRELRQNLQLVDRDTPVDDGR